MYRRIIHCGASTQLQCLVLLSFGSYGYQKGYTIAEVSVQRQVEHVKNNLQNIRTEWMPHSVSRLVVTFHTKPTEGLKDHNMIFHTKLHQVE